MKENETSCEGTIKHGSQQYPKCGTCGEDCLNGGWYYGISNTPYCRDCYAELMAEHNPEADKPNGVYPFEYDEPEYDVKEDAEKHWAYTESWVHKAYVDAFVHGDKHGYSRGVADTLKQQIKEATK